MFRIITAWSSKLVNYKLLIIGVFTDYAIRSLNTTEAQKQPNTAGI